MALRVLKGGLMTSSKNIQICINILSLCIHQKKIRNPKSEFFFLLKTTWLHESLEGLNGSLAHSDGELWPATVRGGIPPRSAFVGAKFWPFFVFWPIIFDPVFSSKSIKGSKDSLSSQESKKTLSEKNVPLTWGPGPGKVGLKLPKHALIVT